LPYPIMHNAQVRLEAGEGSIEIDSFSFVPRLDSIPISISISISNGASPNLGLMLTAFPYVSFCHILQPSAELQKSEKQFNTLFRYRFCIKPHKRLTR
jgi:hypothetical protein